MRGRATLRGAASSGEKASVHCAGCGADFPAGTAVCPTCQTILVAPAGRAATPAWVIVLLLVVIMGLLAYACVLGYQVFFLHQY